MFQRRAVDIEFRKARVPAKECCHGFVVHFVHFSPSRQGFILAQEKGLTIAFEQKAVSMPHSALDPRISVAKVEDEERVGMLLMYLLKIAAPLNYELAGDESHIAESTESVQTCENRSS